MKIIVRLLFYIYIAFCFPQLGLSDVDNCLASKNFPKLILGKWYANHTKHDYIFYPNGLWRESPDSGTKWGNWLLKGTYLEFDGAYNIVLLDDLDLVLTDVYDPCTVRSLKRHPKDSLNKGEVDNDEEPLKHWISPNLALRSDVFRPNDAYNVVSIHPWKGNGRGELNRLSLGGSSANEARYVFKGAWTPDSRFLILLTLSLTGFDCGKSTVWLYDASSNKFVELDRSLAQVGESLGLPVYGGEGEVWVEENEIDLEYPDIVLLRVHGIMENPVKIKLSSLIEALDEKDSKSPAKAASPELKPESNNSR